MVKLVWTLEAQNNRKDIFDIGTIEINLRACLKMDIFPTDKRR